ncbi:integral membrane sensor signal transduction histidine kinase [Thermoanaerobacter mathranii subsp. mathranii str. A3]|uniref:histidine kinase n=1 Tax=Thermoanaerobacter mathranii subsp. mathranii (strain DSM 11426 / CCUG 53645 / CIP 108742 / A3) TaxID=583358 RepID=A0ABM5LPR7_THEM3|nr:HAMP domain-containing sensor histidine kinase [Thermoanaerobacter mathranii]ADH60682.1 integral membrane sensor signal transduction histidine kinase [Thermoanaerobacter mathranii subsp. mathranii str. A3]
MKRFRFKSLTMRIWVTFSVVILIIICSTSILYLFAFRKMDENAKMQDLKVVHEALLKSNDFNQPLSNFSKIKNLRNSDNFIVNIDDNNRISIIDINKRGVPPPPPPPGHNDIAVKIWMTSFIKGDNIHEKQFKEVYNNVQFLFIISSIEYGSTGKSYLISYMPNIKNDTLLYMVIIIGLIFIVIGFFAAKIVANYISKPLKELENYTVKIAHKDWSEPIKIKSEDEIGRLAKAMNRMQKELKRADEEEKTFLQSISHDLKTPVMVIMSHAEAIIDGVYIDSIEKTAEIIKDEATRLEKKINQMLYLNTLDYLLENSGKNTYINLHDLLLRIISRFEVINSKIEWNLDLDDVTIMGDVDKIQVCIENILDNAQRYAEEKICISLKKEKDYAVLEIYNDGPNIDKEHIDHIFDKLYKDKTGNFGLGLAISKKIIDFYNGEIKAVNREKGVSFIIKYPIK